MEINRSFDVVLSQDSSPSGHSAALKKRQDGCAINPMFVGELENSRSCEVTGDKFLDLLESKAALELSLANRSAFAARLDR